LLMLGRWLDPCLRLWVAHRAGGRGLMGHRHRHRRLVAACISTASYSGTRPRPTCR
jgi:hypothetical protein